MKKLYFIIMALISLSNILQAQPVTATLEHGPTSQIFYGPSAAYYACASAVDGDIIILSSGNFDGFNIAKKVKVFGTGHYPNPVNAIPTTITNGIGLSAGSDSTLIEGINSASYIQNNNPVRNIHIRRCRVNTISFIGGSKNCIIEGCVFTFVHFYNKDTANILRNNLIIGPYSGDTPFNNFNNGSIIDNNIISMAGGNANFGTVNYCIFRNNIIYCSNTYSCVGNLLQNNFLKSYSGLTYLFDTLNNVVQNTYTGPITDIISGGLSTFSYTADYHITNPTLYLGTDGTQIGIYGGQYPYKENAIPYNPQIVSKYIAPQTDANGNFQINIKVKAQNY